MLKDSCVKYILYFLLRLWLYPLPTTSSYRFLPERETQTYAYLNYNSNQIANIKDIPHHGLIVYGSRYCSGSLIGSKIVVTAASCFSKLKDESIVVKVGSNATTEYGQIISVLELKIHEYFKHLSSLDNDIALLMLKDHIDFGPNVAKAIILEPEVVLRVGVQVVVTGWGGTEHRLSDIGGGAVFDDLLVGILSSGTIKDKNNYAILTNISYFHRWIILNTNRFLNKYCYTNDKPMQLATESIEYDDT